MIGHAQKAAAKTAWGLIKRQHGTLSSHWNKSIKSHLEGAVRLNINEPFIKLKQKRPAHEQLIFFFIVGTGLSVNFALLNSKM